VHFFSTNFISFFVSVENLLRQIITGILNFFIFSICFSKLQKPFSIASKFSSLKFFNSIQELYFIDFIVATITTKSGFNSQILHFILKNFSAHKSDQNQASVIVYGTNFKASFVAIKLLHP